MVSGVVAGQVRIDLGILLALTWVCAFAGDVTGYLLGRRLARRFLIAHGARVHITEKRLRRVEGFFDRYGPATILIGWFAGLIRGAVPGGRLQVSAPSFRRAWGLGTGLWSATFVLLGYLFWQSLDEVIAIAKRGSLALGAVIALGIALVAGYRYLHDRSRARSSAAPRPSDDPRTDRGWSDGAFLEAPRSGQAGPSVRTVRLKVRSEESS